MRISRLFLLVVLLSLTALGLARISNPAPLSACSWVVTSCGSGCSDNKDLYNCSNNVQIKSVSGNNTNEDSNKKAQSVAPPTVTQYIPPPTNDSTKTNYVIDQNTTKAEEYINNPANGQQTIRDDVTTTDNTGQGGEIVQSVGQTVTLTQSDLIDHAYDAAGSSGSCASCIGLGGGTAERQCYVQCSGSINVGICEGLSIDQCLARAASLGYTANFCTGSQTATGDRAGEFLSCGGTRSTGGCGQVDIYDANGNLVGFVIDKSNCTTTTTTTTSTPPPPSSPPPSSPPPASPPPEEEPGMCVAISKSVQTPKLGDDVSFTCAPVELATRYEFRYARTTINTVSESEYQSLQPNSATSNTSVPITIDKVGRYVAMCRPCYGNNQCETWQVADLQEEN